MPDARGHTVTARIAATAAATDAPAAGLAADEIVTEWTASGRTITFPGWQAAYGYRSEEHTSELQSLMRISYAVFCSTKKKKHNTKRIPEIAKKINKQHHITSKI